MKRSAKTLALALALACAGLVGCTSGAGEAPMPLPGSGSEVDESCPEGETGISEGDVLEGYIFEGYVDPSQGIGQSAVREVAFCDFYNPTGEEVYGPDSAFEEGAPKPKALMINLGAMWCQPCKLEAAEILPEEYAEYQPQGLELVMVLADTNAPGESAGLKELDTWVSGFDVQYVATIDPDRELTNQLNASQFPSNLLVDTRTMTVVANIVGIPDDPFFEQLEGLLAR